MSSPAIDRLGRIIELSAIGRIDGLLCSTIGRLGRICVVNIGRLGRIIEASAIGRIGWIIVLYYWQARTDFCSHYRQNRMDYCALL